MRSCSLLLSVAFLAGGCATKPEVQPAITAQPDTAVRPVPSTFVEKYTEGGGAARYAKEQQYMLGMRPQREGEYVTLEPRQPKGGSRQLVEFKVPPPTVTVKEVTSREVTVHFRLNSSTLNAEAQEALRSAASQGADVVRVTVSGHADATGNPEKNQILSDERAAAVVSYLVANGFPAEKIESTGVGSKKPSDDNSMVEGRARNRRVEITVVGAEKTIANAKVSK